MRYFLFVGGDVNLMESSEFAYSYSSPSSTTQEEHAAPAARPHQQKWNKLFDALIELHQEDPTHYNAANDTATRIDRGFIATPIWGMLQASLQGATLDDPKKLKQAGVSDHAPTVHIFAKSQPRAARHLPIPSFVTSHPSFRYYFEKVVAELPRGAQVLSR